MVGKVDTGIPRNERHWQIRIQNFMKSNPQILTVDVVNEIRDTEALRFLIAFLSEENYLLRAELLELKLRETDRLGSDSESERR